MMNTLIIVGLIVFLIISILFLNVRLYVRVDQSFDLRLKIGRIITFKLDENKIFTQAFKKINLKDLSKIKYDSFMFNNLLKYITIDKLTVIEVTNPFLDTWNIYSNFLLSMSNSYLNNLLVTHFSKVKDVRYILNFNTVGSFELKVEGLFSIKVYKIFKYLIRKRRKNGNKS